MCVCVCVFVCVYIYIYIFSELPSPQCKHRKLIARSNGAMAFAPSLRNGDLETFAAQNTRRYFHQCRRHLDYRYVVDMIASRALFLHPGYDICSCASPLTRRTGNKSCYCAPDVIFNNKKYYLPGSMCVTMAIKHNEWKVLEACSKF